MSVYKVRLFYSYSHKDEELRNSLEIHLSTLRREGLIEEWHDRKIEPGSEWRPEIDEHIDKADIVLLLVSPDFIDSECCYQKELSRALERYERGYLKIIPVIIRPTDWLKTPFAQFQALPTDGKPVTTWLNRDEAWVDVTKGLRKIIENISTEKSVWQSEGPLRLANLFQKELQRIGFVNKLALSFTGSSTGFVDLDKLTDGLHGSDLILVGGSPSTGKTDFVMNIGVNIAKSQHRAIAFFSTRLTPEHLTRKLIASESMVSIHRILRGTLYDYDLDQMTRAMDTLSETAIFLYYNPSVTEKETLACINQIKRAHDLGLIIIDGVENFGSARGEEINTAGVASITKSIKVIARHYDVPVLLTVNTYKNNKTRLEKRPLITDLGNWEYLAVEGSNVVVLLYRDELYDPDSSNKGIVEAIVVKNHYGALGTIMLAYLREYCRFANLAKD